MTRMTSLLERNEQFARGYSPVGLGPPTMEMVVVTCLDHRVDPAVVLGIKLGEVPVIRNAGGRVTDAVLEASAVAEPSTTVTADVELLLSSPLLSPKVSVSGHVYDIATGHVTTTLDARYPSPELQ